MVTLQPKAGTSVLPPENTQSWAKDIQGNNPSLHLHWTFPPNPKLLIKVFFSFWIWLAGSGSYLLLFALHFTCGFKYASILLRELGNTCRLSWSCSLTFSFSPAVLGKLWGCSLSLLCNGHKSQQYLVKRPKANTHVDWLLLSNNKLTIWRTLISHRCLLQCQDHSGLSV